MFTFTVRCLTTKHRMYKASDFSVYSHSINVCQKRCAHWINSIFNKNFGKYEVIKTPGVVTEHGKIPDYIYRPSYFKSTEPPQPPNFPEIKSFDDILKMRAVCYLARLVMNKIAETIEIGITTEDVDVIAHLSAIEMDCYPSPLNYRGFPRSSCISVNNIACHGIPDDRRIQNGDILSIDITIFHDGYHGDCCDTFIVGEVDAQGRKLVKAARRCRDEAIAICGPEIPFKKIGDVVEDIAKQENVTVVPAFVGHGIGTYFHGPPDIYHCHNNYPGVMKPGMTFTIEPVVAQGGKEVVVLEDGWTAAMLDNGRAAQFEHTVLITENGCDILTKYV